MEKIVDRSLLILAWYYSRFSRPLLEKFLRLIRFRNCDKFIYYFNISEWGNHFSLFLYYNYLTKLKTIIRINEMITIDSVVIRESKCYACRLQLYSNWDNSQLSLSKFQNRIVLCWLTQTVLKDFYLLLMKVKSLHNLHNGRIRQQPKNKSFHIMFHRRFCTLMFFSILSHYFNHKII